MSAFSINNYNYLEVPPTGFQYGTGNSVGEKTFTTEDTKPKFDKKGRGNTEQLHVRSVTAWADLSGYVT
jgi:hypothetical protein